MRLVKHLYWFLINSWCIVTSLLQVAMCGSDLLFKQYNSFSKFFSVCLLFPMNECYPDTKLKKPQQPNRPKTVAMVPTGGHIPPVGDLCYKVSSSCFLYITDFCIVFLVWKEPERVRQVLADRHWTLFVTVTTCRCKAMRHSALIVTSHMLRDQTLPVNHNHELKIDPDHSGTKDRNNEWKETSKAQFTPQT